VGFFFLQAEGSLIETAIPKVTKALEVRLNSLQDFPLKEKRASAAALVQSLCQHEVLSI
jgi:hypothetical protein